jgi:hypothetical protein
MSRTIYPRGFPPKGEGFSRVYGPSRALYAAKVAFEKWWLWRYF